MKHVFSLILIASIALGFLYSEFWDEPAKPQQAGKHQSYFSTPEFYERAYGSLEPIVLRDPSSEIRGIVVNHHLLAGNLQAEMFDLVATEESKTVILLSPNHFSGGEKNIEVSTYDWSTPFGVLENDRELSSKLIKKGDYGNSETFFNNEHGVSSLVAFIKKSLPNADIIPIALKSNATNKDIESLSARLDELLPQDALVVASLDFSHDLPLDIAEFHDIRALRTLKDQHSENLDSLDIDSVPVLKTLLTIMKMRGSDNFHLVGHSNSALIIGNKELTETTSYITGYFSKESSQTTFSKDATIMYLGNIELEETTLLSLFSQTPTDQKAKFMRLFLGNDATIAITEGGIEEKYNKLLSEKGLDTVIQRNEEESFVKREINGRVIGIYHAQKEDGFLQDILDKEKIDYLLVITRQADTAQRYIERGADVVFVSDESSDFGYGRYGQGLIINYSGAAIFGSDIDSVDARGVVTGIKIEDGTVEYTFFPYEIYEGEYFLKPGKESVIID